MTLNRLLDNIKSIKVKKVRGQNRYRVVDVRYGSRWSYIAEYDTRAEAEAFRQRRIDRD